MEYVQMTLDDWVKMKQKLRQELIGVKQSFVRIGYALRQIDDQRLYENDGYKSIAEFAKAEYGLEASTTSRFMSINREYSIDGYSEHLRPEYTDLGRSQLEEMLKLPDSDRQMIQPEASREDMIDDYVYYWSLKKKLISDIKSKGLRYKTINGNGVEVEKTNDSVVNLQKTTATMLKILADLRLKDPVPEPEKATDGYL